MNIIKLPIEYRNVNVDSRFRLVLMASQRARQLSEGSDPLVQTKSLKNTTTALEEAIEGKLKYLTGEEARKARELEYRMRRERLARESMEEAAKASLEKMEEIKETYKAETAAALAEVPEDEDEKQEDEADEESEEDEDEE